MRYEKKLNKKNYGVLFIADKTECLQEGTRNKKVKIRRKEIKLHYLNCWYSQHLILVKWNVAKMHNYVFFHVSKRCLVSFHLKIKLAEDLIQYGIENHSFGPADVHYPEEEMKTCC